MKIKSLLAVLTAVTLLIGIAGCKKQEPSVQNAVDQTKVAAGTVTDAVNNAAPATGTATDAVNNAAPATGTATDAVNSAAPAAETEAKNIAAPVVVDKAQAIIDQAKSLVDAGKYQDALPVLNGLSGMTLSDAQQKLVDDLKAQIQKAIADKSAVGNLLGK